MTESDLSHLVPANDNVLVWMRPGVQQSAGGLIIPPSAQQISQIGDVLSTAPGVSTPKPGDMVLVGIHAGTHICWKANTPVLLVHVPDIIAVLEPGDEVSL